MRLLQQRETAFASAFRGFLSRCSGYDVVDDALFFKHCNAAIPASSGGQKSLIITLFVRIPFDQHLQPCPLMEHLGTLESFEDGECCKNEPRDQREELVRVSDLEDAAETAITAISDYAASRVAD